MPKVRHHRSSRRVPPPKDSDFDHEINLVNRDEEESSPPPSSAGPSSSQHETPASAAGPHSADGDGRSISEEVTGGNNGQPSVLVQGGWKTYCCYGEANSRH